MADDMLTSNISMANISQAGLVSTAASLCIATATPTNNTNRPTCGDSTPDSVYVRSGVDYLQLGAYVLIEVIGVIGNGFVLGVVALCKDMRTVANYFIVSLSVADLLVCLVIVPIITVTRWHRVWSLGDITCDFLAILNLTCTVASLFNLAAIAVNRVVITRWPGKYPRLFSKSLSVLYIAIAWLFSLLYALLPAFGWGESEFDEIRFVCLFSREAAPSYSIFVAICCVLVSQVICGLCYLTVLITFKRSRVTLEQLPDVRVSGNTAYSERRLTKNLLVIWIAFVVCWLPTMALLIVDPKGALGEKVYTFSAWMHFSNSCVNPIIYGIINKKFRSGYYRLIQETPLLKKCRKFRVTPAPQLFGSGSPRTVQGTSRSSHTEAKFISSDSKPMPDAQLRSGLALLELPKKVTVRGRFIDVE